MERVAAAVRAIEARPSCAALSAAEVAGFLKATLRDYQLIGINWLRACRAKGHGAILGDEMGLGKTIQAIALVASLLAEVPASKHLVVVPLSVADSWRQEFAKFAPHVRVALYLGSKEERAEQRAAVEADGAATTDVFLTTFDLCLRDADFFGGLGIATLVVDEAHRLKNAESKLYQALVAEIPFRFPVLLTGTPVQNNLEELYSLLQFVARPVFKPTRRERFTSHFAALAGDRALRASMHQLLNPFLLRRTKGIVAKSIPPKEEIVLYTGLSEVQKRVYKSILMKDAAAFDNGQGRRTSLLNVLMQLRKCINHPYLFDGVEPEPFKLGDHLVDASQKLKLLDVILPHLQKKGHRVLIFSQMTRVLDILQDYLTYRQYPYERLDGSVRGEERFAAINNFNKNKQTFVFLLSTRAGGLGLTLTGADTVVFYDSDFNPQNDLQAAARAHRIGQTRPVKVLRLVARNTAEELVLRRAKAKLQLTHDVIEGGQFAQPKASRDALHDTSAADLESLLKFGLDTILNADSRADLGALDLDTLLGRTDNGRWVPGTATVPPPSAGVHVDGAAAGSGAGAGAGDKASGTPPMQGVSEAQQAAVGTRPPAAESASAPEMDTAPEAAEPSLPATVELVQDDDGDGDPAGAMVFEGVDYTAKRRDADRQAFEELLAELVVAADEDRPRRQRTEGGWLLSSAGAGGMGAGLPPSRKRKRKEYTPEELEARAEARRKRARMVAEAKQKRAEDKARRDKERQLRLEQARRDMWEKYHYHSTNLPFLPDEAEAGAGDADAAAASLDLGDGFDLDGGEAGQDGQAAARKAALGFVIGNVTMPSLPEGSTGSPIIVHVVDNSGAWGRGGVFSALSRQTPLVEAAYETAGEMNDLTLGDAHLVELDLLAQNGQPLLVALVVAQNRDKHNALSKILPRHLDMGMQRLADYARANGCSVHMPRIGHDTPQFEWYATERLIRKRLVRQGVPTSVYYYRRRQTLQRRDSDAAAAAPAASAAAAAPSAKPASLVRLPTASLPDLLSGMVVYFHKVAGDRAKPILRRVVAFDGDVSSEPEKATIVLYDAAAGASTDEADEELQARLRPDCRVMRLGAFEASLKAGTRP